MIGVDEVIAEQMRQPLAYGGLAGPHRADEKDAFGQMVHGVQYTGATRTRQPAAPSPVASSACPQGVMARPCCTILGVMKISSSRLELPLLL